MERHSWPGHDNRFSADQQLSAMVGVYKSKELDGEKKT